MRRGVEGFLARTGADELIVSAQVHDHAARVRSYELLAEVRAQLAGALRAAQPFRNRVTGIA